MGKRLPIEAKKRRSDLLAASATRAAGVHTKLPIRTLAD